MKKLPVFLLVFLIFPLYAEKATQDVVPYSKEEFSPVMHDIRSAEIITLGSLPFVTLLTTISYSMLRYCNNGFDSSYVPNPLAKTSEAANLNTSEQKMIILSSAGISLALGLTDFYFNHSKKQKEKKSMQESPVTVKPLQYSQTFENKLDQNSHKQDYRKNVEYLYGGLESALF